MSLADVLGLAHRAGLLDPRRVPALTAAGTRWGPTLAAPFAASALMRPAATAIVDHRGEISFGRLDRRSTALAKGLRRMGASSGDHLGILCANHRDFVEVNLAAAKASLKPVLLNTGFAGPQLLEVLEREQVSMVVVDERYLDVLEASGYAGTVVVSDGPETDLPAVRRLASGRVPLLPSRPLAPLLLTSGTTGTPKGAQRSAAVDGAGAAGFLQQIPYRHDDCFLIASPLFHAWGMAQMGVAASLGASLVLAPTFDAEQTLELIEKHKVSVLAVVPVLLQRLLACPNLDHHDLTSLRIVASSGSALPPSVVTEWLERVGPNLYNLYGSTEVGQATLAGPSELARHPNTAGQPLPGSTVQLLDAAGSVVPEGEIGRIFVGNKAQFDGYTGGGSKEQIGGLMSSGDVGFFDDGLLFITGRADDMIVSGGENVFPAEVEDLLLAHPSIADVAVVGVVDDDFGQRLVAHVVRQPGTEIAAKAVKKLVADQLARHKVPRDVRFVDVLPRTTTGKLRRSELT